MRLRHLAQTSVIGIFALALVACGTTPPAASPNAAAEGDLPAPSGAVVQEKEPAPPAVAPAAPVAKASRPRAAITAKAAPKARPVAMAAPEGGVPGGGDNEPAFDNLDVVDPGLNGKLSVMRVGSEPTETHLLSVFAGLKNKTGRRLRLEIQTIYKDAAGDPLNGGSWITFNLNPHEEREYHSASISDQASDFLIRVRRATTL